MITKYGGTRDYFGDLATYVDPSSLDSIRNGIVAALEAPVDPALRARMRAEFLWQRVAQKTAAVYREVLGAPAAA